MSHYFLSNYSTCLWRFCGHCRCLKLMSRPLISQHRTGCGYSTLSPLNPRHQFRFGHEKSFPYNNLHIVRLASNNGGSAFQQHQNLKRIRLMKALFSTLLFGGTLLTALAFRKKRQNHLKDIMQECIRLPPNPDYSSNSILYKYKDFILPDTIVKDVLPELPSFEVKEDDVYVVSFPKTGTTWIQEIVYLIATDMDMGKASKSLGDRFPFLEFPYPGIHSIKQMESPRFIKSHLPYSLLPPQIQTKKPKILYIIRNPKDVVVSYYHFARMLTLIGYEGTFGDFFRSFLKDEVIYGPLWKHYQEFWDLRNEDNVLIIFYEDLQKDIENEIRRIATFLGKSLTDEDIAYLAKHCSFKEMSNNPSVNYSHWDDLGIRKKDEAKFMRKGQVGDWKNYFTPEMNSKMESWIKSHFTDMKELRFTFEL